MDGNLEIQEGKFRPDKNEKISGIKLVFQVSDSNSNIDVLIEGKSFKVIIDSGESVNFMDKDTFNSLKA